MARLKELTTWSRYGTHYVKLEFVNGTLIEQHSFKDPKKANAKARQLRIKWAKDLIESPQSPFSNKERHFDTPFISWDEDTPTHFV